MKSLCQKFKIGATSIAVFAVAAAPVGVSAVSDNANTTINATVNEVISIATSGTVAMSMTPTPGGVVSSSSDTVSVSTNATAGYNLSVADGDANTSLVSGGNSIVAHNGTYGTPTALTNGNWGFAVAGGNFDATYSPETNNTTSTSVWAGMPASGAAQNLKTTSAVANNDTTTVWYGARVDASQPDGTYTNTVTYTATTN